MTFADTADRGVARHLTEGIDGMSDQERVGTAARRSKCRFGPAWPPPITMTS